jgi:hypothetical protein
MIRIEPPTSEIKKKYNKNSTAKAKSEHHLNWKQLQKGYHCQKSSSSTLLEQRFQSQFPYSLSFFANFLASCMISISVMSFLGAWYKEDLA